VVDIKIRGAVWPNAQLTWMNSEKKYLPF